MLTTQHSTPAPPSPSRTSPTRLRRSPWSSQLKQSLRRSLCRDETVEFAVDSRKLNTALAVPKNNHAVPEKTDVKVVGERAGTEVTDM